MQAPEANPWQTARERIEAWRARGFELNIRGLNVFAVDSSRAGAAPEGAFPLLLVHGYPSSSLDYAHVWDAFAARYRVIAFDFPGFGFSARPRPGTYRYSLFEQADVALELWQRLGVERGHVLAHDYATSVLTEILPDATLTRLETAGHYPMLEEPENFAHAALDWPGQIRS